MIPNSPPNHRYQTSHEAVRQVDDEPRRCWQHGVAHLLVHVLERRDDLDQHHRDDADRDHEDADRVVHRALDLTLELDVLLDVDREAVQDRVEDAADLAGGDQVDVELVEHLRVLGAAPRRTSCPARRSPSRENRTFANALFSLCDARMSRHCTSGRPASIIVASWRVKICRSFGPTPEPIWIVDLHRLFLDPIDGQAVGAQSVLDDLRRTPPRSRPSSSHPRGSFLPTGTSPWRLLQRRVWLAGRAVRAERATAGRGSSS